MPDIEMKIHDIINDTDGVIFVEENGSRLKILLDAWEKELLRKRLQEK
jgi:hypothetical protein